MMPHRPSELAQAQAALEAATAAFLTAGGRPTIISSLDFVPAPPRRAWIDPETVLRRKRRGMSAAERAQLKSMTEAL